MDSELRPADIAARLTLARRSLDDGDACGALATLRGAVVSLRSLPPAMTGPVAHIPYGTLDVRLAEAVAAVDSGRDPSAAIGAAIRQAETVLVPLLVSSDADTAPALR
jgi:hypothetical protein